MVCCYKADAAVEQVEGVYAPRGRSRRVQGKTVPRGRERAGMRDKLMVVEKKERTQERKE